MATKEIAPKVAQLEKLLKDAQKPKIVWEEIEIVSQKAFDLQDEIMNVLAEQQEMEQDIESIQNLFETREYVWDLMYQLALVEQAIKDKTFAEGGYIKGCDEHGCGGHHHHEDGCDCGCGHDHKEPQKAAKKKTKKKTKK